MLKLNIHEKILKEEIFFLKSKWPHFDILFEGIKKIAKLVNKNNKKVLFLERTNLYGGISLFSPYFKIGNAVSVDCVTENLKKRGHYNKKFLKNKNLIKIKSKFQRHYTNINIKKKSFDFIIIPNLLHHIESPSILFNQVKSILKPGGYIFVFEPLIRELHQIPEDYTRFTPYGLNKHLQNIGFDKGKIKFTGGPFSCMAYYLDQSLQYIPKKNKKKFIKKINYDQVKLFELDKLYRKNLERKNTFSPMAFSIFSKFKS